MRRRLLVLSLSFVLLAAGTTFVRAEQVVEVWRGGGFNTPCGVSANPTDGSCWVADMFNNQVVHLAQDGTELWRGGGFNHPYSVSVNPTDGSCWVADTLHCQVVHLAQDGTELWRGCGFDYTMSVSVNPRDGSCWVTGWCNSVTHLAQDGRVLLRRWIFCYPMCCSVDPTDGSCWVADQYGVTHLAQDGTQLWWGGAFNRPYGVAVNPADSSCWVTNRDAGEIVHLARDGAELWRGGGFNHPWSVSANPLDGSCWVADAHGYHQTQPNQIVHLAEDGTELWRGGGFMDPWSVSVNPADGSCWVSDSYNNQVVHLAVLAPPTAEAGADVTIHWSAQGSTVLQGAASSPMPNASLTYRWSDITGGGSTVLQDWTAVGVGGAANLDLWALSQFGVGAFALQLEVSDGTSTVSDSLQLTITDRPPTADAGGNVMIISGAQGSTILTGSTTPATDGDQLRYRWSDLTGGQAVVLQDWTNVGAAGEAHLALSAGQFSIGQYTLRLEVTDGLETAQSDMVLTIGNSPPTVAVSGGGIYQIWLDPITISGGVGDFDGDLITWSLKEGDTVHASGQLRTEAGGAAVTLPAVNLTGLLSLGPHSLVLTASDGVSGEVASRPCQVTVIDTVAPSLAPAPSITQLWPPNHTLVPVIIQANAYDLGGGPVSLAVTVVSDEAAGAAGTGNTEPDWIIDRVQDGPGGEIGLRLRSERAGSGVGRTYTITIVATDSSGNTSSAQVHIIAPHDKGKKK